jgi:formylglycine-generating enzyme
MDGILSYTRTRSVQKVLTTYTQENARWSKDEIKPIFADINYLKHLLEEPSESIAHQPVTNISWFAARAYCESVDKRLPSLYEWEFVAQASATRINGLEEPEYRQTILDWYAKPAEDSLPNVQNTEANFWGVRGMHGVVWELINDFNTSLVTGESRADSQLENQLFCGAGATAATDPSDYAAFMRYALRSSYEADYTMTSLGFRCAKDLASQEVPETNN